jgi:hypothetical protein
MTQPTDMVTFAIPRASIADIPGLWNELTEPLHKLLERNTEGTLNATEDAALRTLIQMAQLSQIISIALQSPSAA